MGVIVARGSIVFRDAVAPWMLISDGPPRLATVDRLARLYLAAVRSGGAMRVTSMCPVLAELVDFAGLSGQLGGQLGGQPGRQAEDGEQVGVEERVEGGDPPA